MSTHEVKSIGVLTSGGDAPGMNAAVRAVIRSPLMECVKQTQAIAEASGLVTGAEQVYMHEEEGVTLADLQRDLAHLIEDFQRGKPVGLLIRNEAADHLYTTDFICSLFEKEGRGLFDVRQAIVGHLLQGGDPSPFDRIQATRLAKRCVDFLLDEAEQPTPVGSFIGLLEGETHLTSLEDLPRLGDLDLQRPRTQWWLELQSTNRVMARFKRQV